MPSERNPELPIDGTGGEVVLQKPDSSEVNVRIRQANDPGATFAVRVSDHPGDYLDERVDITGDVDLVFTLTDIFVKVEVTSGTGGSGDTADVSISAAPD